MNELINTHDDPALPPANSANAICQRTAAGTPGFLRRVCDFFRRNIGLKPLYLTERAAEAEVRRREAVAESLEIENKAKAIKAQSGYEHLQAKIRCMELDAEAKHAKTMAEVAAIRATTELQRIQNRHQKAIASRDEYHSNSPAKLTTPLNITEKERSAPTQHSQDAPCADEQDTRSS